MYYCIMLLLKLYIYKCSLEREHLCCCVVKGSCNNILLHKAAFTPGQHVARLHVAVFYCCADVQHVAGNKQHVACISATCIPLYPAPDGQQTGNNNFVAGNMLPWCKRGLTAAVTAFTWLMTVYQCLYNSSDKKRFQ